MIVFEYRTVIDCDTPRFAIISPGFLSLVAGRRHWRFETLGM